MSKKIYFIISAYNEESNLELLHQSLCLNVDDLLVDCEFVVVNDGSQDNTLDVLLKLQSTDKRITVVNQTKNFGHELAMTAGLNYVAGLNEADNYAVLFMDADMQHPASVAREMIEQWLEGHPLVLTQRTDNLDTGLRYKILGNLFYKILNMLSDVEIPRNMPDFRLLDKKYVLWMNTLNENDRMFRGMLSLVGLKEAKVIEFEAPKRHGGKSSYNFFNLFKLALDSVIQFSYKPLRVASFIGLVGCLLSVLFACFSIFQSIVHSEPRTGYLTLLCVTIFCCSLTIFFLGIIGEYVGRIHMQVKNRPLYFSEIIKKNGGAE